MHTSRPTRAGTRTLLTAAVAALTLALAAALLAVTSSPAGAEIRYSKTRPDPDKATNVFEGDQGAPKLRGGQLGNTNITRVRFRVNTQRRLFYATIKIAKLRPAQARWSYLTGVRVAGRRYVLIDFANGQRGPGTCNSARLFPDISRSTLTVRAHLTCLPKGTTRLVAYREVINPEGGYTLDNIQPVVWRPRGGSR